MHNFIITHKGIGDVFDLSPVIGRMVTEEIYRLGFTALRNLGVSMHNYQWNNYAYLQHIQSLTIQEIIDSFCVVEFAGFIQEDDTILLEGFHEGDLYNLIDDLFFPIVDGFTVSELLIKSMEIIDSPTVSVLGPETIYLTEMPIAIDTHMNDIIVTIQNTRKTFNSFLSFGKQKDYKEISIWGPHVLSARD